MYSSKVASFVQRNFKFHHYVRFKHNPPSNLPNNYYDPDTINENPMDRCKRFLKRDIDEMMRKMNDPFDQYQDDQIFPKTVDILIVGGGVIGSSIAYWIQNKCRDGITVAVVEKDLSVNKDILSNQKVLLLIKYLWLESLHGNYISYRYLYLDNSV